MESKTSNLLYGSRVIGIELQVNNADSTLINLVYLEKKEDRFRIIRSEYALYEMGEIYDLDNTGSPIFLTVNGYGVSHKKFEQHQIKSDEEMLKDILPDASIDQYCMQKVDGADGSLFVSVIRKNGIKKVIDRFGQYGITIVNVGLGPFCLGEINSRIGHSGDEIRNSNYHLVMKDGLVEKYDWLEDEVTESIMIDGHELLASLAVAYATAANYFSESPIHTDLNTLERSRINYKRNKSFRIVVYFTLAFFVSIILINALVGINYSKENNILSTLVLEEVAKIDDFDRKEEKIKNLRILKEGVENSRSTAYYMEQIFSSRGPDISVDQLFIFPELESSYVDQPIVYEHSKIKIEGTCRSFMELKLWIKRLKKLKHVKEVESVGDMSNKHTKKFQLRITLN